MFPPLDSLSITFPQLDGPTRASLSWRYHSLDGSQNVGVAAERAKDVHAKDFLTNILHK